MSEPFLPEESIFAQALDIESASERLAFLDRACGSNPALRAEVEALLHASGRSGDLLDLHENVADTRNLPACEGPGTVIGPYKLLEHIGEGGMGIVWMAQQTDPIQRRVAVKVVKAGMDSKQVLARFEAERQALALMEHPNIAKVLDAGKTPSGRPYFVMELVKGQPITSYCDEKRLGVRARLELFGDVCRAVQHAHQKGIIHRDLKPSNVLVAPYDGKPVVKVIDFGVAKAAGQRLTDKTLFTGFGALVGTPEYMSPEQAEVNNQDIDTRSDIYSLGVLLYELLTGSTPLTRQRIKDAALLEVLRVIREEEPPRPSTRLSQSRESLQSISAQRQMEPAKLTKLVRGELDWMVMKALDKDRNRRYETANGFALDVQRYLRDEAVSACPPSALYRLRKFARRNKLLITTATMIAVTLLAATVTVTWNWWQAEQARQREEAAKELALKAERTARLHAAEALVGQARGTRLSKRPGQRFEALAALKKAMVIGRELDQPPPWFDRLRNEAIAALALPDLQIAKEFGQITGKGAVQLSDDFELYMQTTAQGDWTVRRAADDREVARFSKLGTQALGGFGPGRVVALLASGNFQMWDLSRGEASLRLKEKEVHSWCFHPNGRLVALAHWNGSISIHEMVATGIHSHVLKGGDAIHSVLQFHPTEPFIAVFSYHSRVVWVRDLQSGAVVASAASPWWGGNGYGAWSPDGRTLLVPQGDGPRIQEYAFDRAATPALRPTRPIDGGPFQGGPSLTFNSAGDRFVSCGWSGTVNLFDAASGQFLFATPGLGSFSGAPPNYLQFDPTGKWLAGALVGEGNSRIGLWSIAEGREYRYLLSHSVATRRGPAIHPGNRLAAIGHTDGVVLFDLQTGRELAFVPVAGSNCARFDGAGNLLTNGFTGFFRWPVRPHPAAPEQLLIAPPERLPFHAGNYPVSASQDGRVIAQAMFGTAHAGGWVLHPDSPTARLVDAGVSMGWTSVSPDGRWVAFASHGATVIVHDAATGARAWQSPADQIVGYCCFSPDGRWLLTEGGRTYHVGTWEPGPRLGPGSPWDTTADMVVMSQDRGIYRLVELTTGRELARLEDPEQTAGQAVFSPDGTKLVIEAGNGLRVWDLRRLRASLDELGLDWDAPPFPRNPDKVEGPPLEVVFDPGTVAAFHQAQGHARLCDELRKKGDLAGALAATRKAQAAAPEDPDLSAYLAWLLAVCPDPKSGDAKQAVELAKKAVNAVPDRWQYWRTLGLTHQSAGDHQAAVKALTRSLELRHDGESFDYFPLAAAHQRLGNKAEARTWYDRGVAWMAFNSHPYAAELALIRADAEAALGIAPNPKRAPVDESRDAMK
jgi:serine/threonine protein kinase/WD40 repeat protein